jgi:hypothetical protein
MTNVDSVRRSVLQSRYEATTYRAVPPDFPIRIRIGRVCPELDAMLADRGVSDWAFVSAANPASVPLGTDANRLRHGELMHCLERQPYALFAAEGWPDEPGWQAEPSVLILGMAYREALALARHFGQNAIVCGCRGEAARLEWVET